MGQRLRDAGAQETVGHLGSVAALLAGTQALSPGEAQPKQFGIVMGEADIGDAGGKKARAAAACFDPCLRLLRAEAAQSLVGQRVEQGFLVGEIARSEEHTSELKSLMRTSYAAFCLKKKKTHTSNNI